MHKYEKRKHMKKIMSVYARIDHTHSIYVSLWRCVRGGEGGSNTPVPAADIERDRAWDPQRFSPPEHKKRKKYIDQEQIAEYTVGFNDCPLLENNIKNKFKKKMLGRQGISISQ
jgi:hypothetical protein